MAKLDSEIAKVHSQLVQLAQKRHALKAKVNQRHGSLIHRLPLEISSRIFAAYVHRVYDNFNPEKAAESNYTRDWYPALFLSSICATWRKIALATPEIWRFINIPLLEDDPDVDLKIELLKECVARANRRTLLIGVFQFQLNEDPRFSELEEKLDTLTPLFAAIQEIACRSEEITLWGFPPGALGLLIPGDTPNLRAVRIAKAFRFFEDGDGPVGWNTGDFPLAGPLLRTLEFGDETYSLLEFADTDWETITTVTMSAIEVKEGIDILRQASCLTSCSFVFESHNKDHITPVVNSALQNLHINFSQCGADSIQKFANGVTLPSLRELSLRTSALPNMKPLFERSQCQIRTLTLILDKKIPEDDVFKLLNILPSIEHFVLETSFATPKPITNKFFERLCDPRFASTGASAKPPLLPKLTSFSYAGNMAFTWPAFLQIFPPENDVHTAGRPLSEVSLRLKLPKGKIGDLSVIASLRQIQQSKIKLVVEDHNGKDLL